MEAKALSLFAEVDVGVAVGIELVALGSVDHTVAFLITGRHEVLDHGVAAPHLQRIVRYEGGREDLLLPVGVETVAHLLGRRHVAAQEGERLSDLFRIGVAASGDVGDVTAEIESRKQGQRLVDEAHALDGLEFDQRTAHLTALGVDQQHAVAAQRAVGHCIGSFEEGDLLDIVQVDRFEQVGRKSVDDIGSVLVRNEGDPVDDQQRRILPQQGAVAAQVEKGAFTHHAALGTYAQARETARERVAHREIAPVDILDIHGLGRAGPVGHRHDAVGRVVTVGSRLVRLLQVNHQAVTAEQIHPGRKIALLDHVEHGIPGEGFRPENAFRAAHHRFGQFAGADLRGRHRLAGIGIQHETHDRMAFGRIPVLMRLRRHCTSPCKEHGQKQNVCYEITHFSLFLGINNCRSGSERSVPRRSVASRPSYTCRE